jgi:hypothetical protein
MSKRDDNVIKCGRCGNWIALTEWHYAPPRAIHDDCPTLPPEALAAGKKPKVALIARMLNFLVMLNAVLRQQTPWALNLPSPTLFPPRAAARSLLLDQLAPLDIGDSRFPVDKAGKPLSIFIPYLTPQKLRIDKSYSLKLVKAPRIMPILWITVKPPLHKFATS